MLTLRATANHVIALQYLCMCLMSQMFLFYFIFYGGALVFLGGAGAPASPSLAPPVCVMFHLLFYFFALSIERTHPDLHFTTDYTLYDCVCDK